MKGWQLKSRTGIDGLAMAEVPPPPAPGPGQIKVRMRAGSLNYRDLSLASGRYARSTPPDNMVLLSDGAGEVLAVGASVTAFAPGDRVAGTFFQSWVDGPPDAALGARALGGGVHGILAEEVLLNADGAVKLPPQYSYEEAATLPCAALTAWNALFETGRLMPGQTILVQGSGGVSVFALQFAVLAGARIIATSSSDDKLARLRELGAHDTINYKAEPDWGARAMALTGGRGVDNVIEVGGVGTLPQSLAALRPGGQVSIIGLLSGVMPTDMSETGGKNAQLKRIFVGSTVMFENMNRAIALHGLKPVIDRVFPFVDTVAAYRHLESGRHFGKVVIAID